MKKRENIICPHCDKMQTVKVRKTNHILHILLSIITAGVWLIVYAGAAFEAVMAGKPKCRNCHQKMV